MFKIGYNAPANKDKPMSGGWSNEKFSTADLMTEETSEDIYIFRNSYGNVVKLKKSVTDYISLSELGIK
jgi:hypothetical protein